MRFPWKGNKADNRDNSPSVRDLSEETRADVEAMLEDGSLPSDVSRELGVPLNVVQAIRRMQIRERQLKEKSKDAPAPRREEDQVRALLVRQIETAELEARLEKIKEEAVFERERRALELRIKRLELAEKERELEEEDDGDDFEPINDDGDVNVFGFLKELLKKQGRGNAAEIPPPPATPTPNTEIPPSVAVDVTKPLPPEAIDREIAKATPADLAQIRAAPSRMVRDALRQRYPGITEENLTAIMTRLKPAKTKQVTL